MNELSLHLPLPPRKLQPNRKASLHWTQRADLVRQAKRDAHIAATAQIRKSKTPGLVDGLLWKRVQITPAFFFRTNHKRDESNLIGWLKATEDGLEGVVYPNDSGVTWAKPVIHTGSREEGLVLHIERIS